MRENCLWDIFSWLIVDLLLVNWHENRSNRWTHHFLNIQKFSFVKRTFPSFSSNRKLLSLLSIMCEAASNNFLHRFFPFSFPLVRMAEPPRSRTLLSLVSLKALATRKGQGLDERLNPINDISATLLRKA